MNKKLMTTAIAASTLGGAAAGAALLAPGQAGAQDDTEPSIGAPAPEAGRPAFGARIADALEGLVDDGTLTEAQVDAVIDALADARPEGREGFRHRHHGPHGHRFGRFAGPEIAEILGLEPAELRDALRDGQTVAELAAEQGVDIQTVIDGLVDAAEQRLDEAVENGRLEADRADEMLDEIEERIESHFEDGTDA